MFRSLLFSILYFLAGFLCALFLADLVGAALNEESPWLVEPLAIFGGFVGFAVGLAMERPERTPPANPPHRKPRSRRFYFFTTTIVLALLASLEWATVEFVGLPWIDRIGDAGKPVYGRNFHWLLVTLIELFTLWMVLRTIRLAPKKWTPTR